MRMEELSEHRYIKGTDTVEAYLLQLVEDYFKNSSVAPLSSREYVIERAVRRMQEELSFDGLGVLSITLPGDTEPRTGAVSISIEDLGGEPAIIPKRSAFNVNFGVDQNTACEGNDPRLSDKRFPTEHTHSISQIVGLEGRLTTIESQFKKNSGINHTHNNKTLLDMLVYSGSKSVIDLTVIDTLEGKIIAMIDAIKLEIAKYKDTFKVPLDEVDKKIQEIKDAIAEINQFIIDTNKEYYELSKQYTDNAIVESEKKILQEVEDNYVSTTGIQPLLDLASTIPLKVGTQEIKISTYIPLDGDERNYQFSVPINVSLLNEITNRNRDFDDCIFELTMKYSLNGKKYYEQLPFVSIDNNNIDGILQISIDRNDKKIIGVFDTTSCKIPPEFNNGKICLTIYSGQDVTL